jgi:ubiquitin C-terminal hydrolase
MTSQAKSTQEALEAKQRANWTCEICGVKQGTQRRLTIGYRTYNVLLKVRHIVRDGQPALMVLCERCMNKVPRQENKT